MDNRGVVGTPTGWCVLYWVGRTAGSNKLLVGTTGMGVQVVGRDVEAAVEVWIEDLGGVGLAVSASTVQDRLFDLWGLLDEGEARRTVERWLTETLDRDLYTAENVTERLRELTELEAVGS